ncbi:hypothetical protein I6E52_04715 [Salinibacterium sp. NG253]|uniref:hypothetical protein n=1 Tax=Salinibacterium sp. NG253 TaxID=2792039 RepID=UPI0018CCA921|nr:hypothetical protein [Salinibacterium sp. NG253]MBH0116141.1 hypothetical protein [Salinibacterium sp. NG253]
MSAQNNNDVGGLLTPSGEHATVTERPFTGWAPHVELESGLDCTIIWHEERVA